MDKPYQRSLESYAQECYAMAKEKGFETPEDFTQVTLILEKLMLIVTEVAEAAEEVRGGRMEGFAEEIADIVIRTLHLGYGLGIDIEHAVAQKIVFNRLRPWRHGKLA